MIVLSHWLLVTSICIILINAHRLDSPLLPRLVVTEVSLLGVLLVDAGEVVYGVVHHVVRVQRVLEVTGDLLHGDPPSLVVLAQVHVEAVGEGEAQQERGHKHLNSDDEVLVGCCSGGAMQQGGPLQDSQQQSCTTGEGRGTSNGA